MVRPGFSQLCVYAFGAILIALGTGALLAACGSNNGNGPLPLHPAAAGQLSQVLDRLQQSPSWQASGCDGAFAPAQREIVGVLDGHAGELAKLAAKNLNDRVALSKGALKSIDLGSTLLLGHAQVPGAQKKGWVTEDETWSGAIAEYAKLKPRPLDTQWLKLDTEVRTLLANDEIRLTTKRNLTLGPDDEPMLQALKKAYETCLADSACSAPKIAGDAAKFRDSNAAYIALWNQLQGYSDAASRRAAMQLTLSDRLTIDLAPYGIISNAAVRRASPGELDLPLDPGTLAPGPPGQHALEDLIEGIWQSDNLKIRVQWATQSPGTNDGIYRLDQNPAPDEPARTIFQERRIVIGLGQSDRALAREVGRALGLGDRTFLRWVPEKCKYTVTMDDGDLMSRPGTGAVTAAEWTQLDHAYPQ